MSCCALSFAQKYCYDFFAEGVGQVAGFAKQFESHILDNAVALFGENINVFIL